MKPFSLLLALLLVFPGVYAVEDDDPIAEDPDEEVLENTVLSPVQPEPKSESEDELELAVMMTLDSLQEQLESLRSMQDVQSTVAATPRLRKAMCIRYKLYNMSFDFDEYRERCTEQASAITEECNKELDRLGEKEFFGVMTVRALFCADRTVMACTGEQLRAADPLLKDDLDEIEDFLKQAGEKYKNDHKWLTGGPGTTRETAWCITSESDVIPRERHFLHQVLRRGYCGQALHEVDGRYYDCLYLIVTKDGEPYRLEQWFDITPYYKAEQGTDGN